MILQKYLMFLGFSDTAFFLTDFAEKYFGFWIFYFNRVIYLMKIPFHEIRKFKHQGMQSSKPKPRFLSIDLGSHKMCHQKQS